MMFALGAAVAHAEPPRAQLVGQVTETATHRALEGVQISVSTPDGATLSATSNAHGIYHVALPDGGAYAVTATFAGGRVERIVTVDRGKAVAFDIAFEIPGEVIEVHGTRPPPPKPVGHLVMPRYSDRAIASDVWTRAWLLLDIDETGVVRRAKFLHHPGYDLDALALEHVFATRFTSGSPTIMLWTLEWPSYGWLRATNSGFALRLPEAVTHKPCRGTAPLNLDSVHPTLRDCTPPDFSRFATEPWIERP